MARFLKNKQKSKGTAPGSLIFIGRQKMEDIKIRVVQYNKDELKILHPDFFSDIKSYLSDDHITWISLYGLHNTEYIKNMGEIFQIPPLILEDILNTDERPKFDEDNQHIFIILKSLFFHSDLNKAQIDQVSIIVGTNYVITIQETDSPYFADIDKRLESGTSKIRSYTPDYLCYALLDTLVDSYILNIEKLGTHIEAQEKDLLTSNKQLIENIYHYKTELSFIRKNVRPVKEVITRFITSESDLINSHTFNYLKDLENLITQALEAIEIYYAMVNDQHNIYNTNTSNSVNDVMKVLTIFSAIFIPLTFIVGVYGMNFNYIPELQHHSAYFILWGVMIIIAIFMLLFFKKKKWL
ncbi:magnesium/cobalt transporter CorA [Culturomica massiliensis]|jgi:magnesium transporter|uniref:magnesium/cobalt transporter CorA n=2 Tax=Culturomica TaxID=1926651 RepID=UPI00033C3ABA|nr:MULTISPECIES: magnesium/cobalt transporter CorA [Odoribacteraceae]RHV93489.1 magnesium and cobalt transport protein CorA [Odoribacter sp. OF09-27XD]CCZ10361.1 magnesium and cobalt transporter CorA [Odoribacter sp. CAG:788]